jgi:recombination protein RecA
MSAEKKTTEKKVEEKKVSGTSALAKAKATIFKATSQKPMQPVIATLGHVSSGSFPIDNMIGGSLIKSGEGQICPGYPRRRIIEIYGPESSGKTTLLIHAMVEAQRAGGTAMFIDFEHSLDHKYAKALGLSYDENKLLVYQPDTMEEGFKILFVGIAAGVDVIGVDSIAAMVPKKELERGFDEEAKIGAIAAPFARALPKFIIWLQKYPRSPGNKEIKDPNHPGTVLMFVNQTRALIAIGGGGGHGANENTTGGWALKFYAYLRVRVSRYKSEFIERKDPVSGKKRRFPYGNVTDVKIVKTKIADNQGHSTQIFIRYGVGIDDYLSIIETGVTQKIIKKEGPYYSLGENRFQGKDKFRQFLISNPKVYNALRTKLAQIVNSTAVQVANELEDEDELLEGFDLENDSLDSDIEAEVEEVIAEVEASDSAPSEGGDA